MSYLPPLDRFDAGSVGSFIGPFGGNIEEKLNAVLVASGPMSGQSV